MLAAHRNGGRTDLSLYRRAAIIKANDIRAAQSAPAVPQQAPLEGGHRNPERHEVSRGEHLAIGPQGLRVGRRRRRWER